jgi:cyanophycinase
MTGPVALVGGDELKPGNEPHDRLLAGAAGDGPAFVLATAAARQRPDLAVENARRWFRRLGLAVRKLPVLRRTDARSKEVAALAATGRFFYLVGGDPGLVVSVLRDSPVWEAIVAAWKEGAALAGSSAGAMALGEWTLIRDRWPNHTVRRYVEALNLVPRTTVLPHYNSFGHRWLPSAQAAAPAKDVILLGIDERTAAVWDGRTWSAMGAGTVTVIGLGGKEEFPPGQALQGLPDPRW